MTNTTKQVALVTNAMGQPIAYRYERSFGNWYRMGREAAELAIATGAAIQVPFCSWANGKPSPMNQTADQTGGR